MQACPEGGHIELSAEPEGDDVILTVSDTGKGIDPSLHEQLFDPFFTTRPDGTGLGLAIVRNAIQAHGGEIVVQSNPGEGSRFIIRLPAIKM
jgi:signal transduction histidine kinase